jgi:hypothetical protein
MRLSGRALVGGVDFFAIFVTFILAEPAQNGYSPITPPSALHTALRSELKIVQGWVNDRDFASADQTTQGLTALAQLYRAQGSEPAWREKTTALANLCSRLGSAARNKDGPECNRLTQELGRLLDDLVKTRAGSPTGERDFKPHGSTKTWMLLMDGAYSDAKTAKTPQEFEQLALALAEEANAYQYARADGRWRGFCVEVRSGALGAAEKARAKDLAGARVALKAVYRTCEACHERSRK